MVKDYKFQDLLYKGSCFISLFLLFIVGCSDDILEPSDLPVVTKGEIGDSGSSGSVTRSDSTLNGEIVLGVTIPNPYTLDTVRKAFTKVYPNGYGQMGPSNFVATDLYIRFLPVNDEEYKLLENSGIIMTTLPMDRVIVQGGTSYFDPTLNPDLNEYTWQYSIIPVTKTIPDVRYEILKQLCNIEPKTDGQQGPGVLNNSVLASIEAKAYQMTGQTLAPPPSGSAGAEGWRPTGVIQVWDDLANQFVGAKGANVVCKAFCFITRGVTDSYGRYSTNSKRGKDWKVTYEIQWGRDSWKVQDGKESREAIYAGPTRNSGWSVDIKGGKQETFATVTRALERMYNQFNDNVSRPTGSSKLKVVCINADGSKYGDFTGSSFLGLDTKAIINVWRYYKGTPRATHLIFGTTIHELGHAVHFRRMSSPKTYNNTEKIIKESWARLLQNYITELEYKDISPRLSLVEQSPLFPAGPIVYGIVPHKGPFVLSTNWNCQDWPYRNEQEQPGSVVTKMLAYSPLLIDFVDADNQGIYYKALGISKKWSKTMYKKFPNDDVRGYTLSQIESAVFNTKNLEELRWKIKAIRNNSAENIKIDTLINKVKYYWDKYK